MSASLVGSEMCIRDRNTRSTGRSHDHLRGLNTVLLQSFWNGVSVLDFCPVSYTHLTLPTICSV
eukprot:10539723-Alexandrium_andersonii.AAC.1